MNCSIEWDPHKTAIAEPFRQEVSTIRALSWHMKEVGLGVLGGGVGTLGALKVCFYDVRCEYQVGI